MVSLSLEVWMLDFYQLEDDVAGGALHPLVAHVGISQVRVTGRSWFHLQRELLNSGNDLLRIAQVTLPADDFAFSLASRANLGVHVVISAAQFHSPCNSSLAVALVTGNDIVWVFSACSFAVGTCHLLFDKHIQLFAQVEILQLQKHLDLELRALQLVEIELVVDVRIVHLLDSHAVIQVLLVFVIEGLVCCVIASLPTLIFSNRSLEPGFLSG